MAKRKREVEESDEIDPLIGLTIHYDGREDTANGDAPRGGGSSQVLPVITELPSDWSGNPSDGAEYLWMVREQAKSIPVVIRAANYTEAYPTPPSSAVATPIPSAVLPGQPSEEWRSDFIDRFTAFREVVASASLPNALEPFYYPIPGPQDTAWKSYINGKKRKAPSPTKAKQSSVAAEPVKSLSLEELVANAIGGSTASSAQPQLEAAPPPVMPVDADEERKYMPKEPLSDLVRSIDKNMVLVLLTYFGEWISERLSLPSTSLVPRRAAGKKSSASTPAIATIPAVPSAVLTPLEARWIFALLSVLQTLLASEDIATLRDLAKECLNGLKFLPTLYATKNGQTEQAQADRQQQEANLWMVVAAVSSIWRQTDLWP